MKYTAAILLAVGATLDQVRAIQLENKSHLHSKHKAHQHAKNDLVQNMWSSAVEVSEPKSAENLPFHFDLVGLAEEVTKTAASSAKIQKLSAHVREAKKTLEMHKAHVKEIQELMEKADGDQKKELKDVLKSAQSHVSELETTVNKAEEEVKKESEKEAKTKDQTNIQTEAESGVAVELKQKAKSMIEEHLKELKEQKQKLDEKIKSKQEKLGKQTNEKKKDHESKKLTKLQDQAHDVDLDIEVTDQYLKDFDKQDKKIQSLVQSGAEAGHDKSDRIPLAQYDAIRGERTKKLDGMMEAIYKVRDTHKDLKQKILENEQKAKMILNGTNPDFKEKEEEISPEEKKELEEMKEKMKPLEAHQVELQNLKRRIEHAERAHRKEQEKTIALQNALEQSAQNIKKAAEQVEKDRKWREEQKRKQKEAERSLVQVTSDFKSEQDTHAKVETELKDTKAKLTQTQKTLETLKQKHDEETKALFENKHTLKFIKQMKHYKEEWWSKTSDDDRKKIATQMASSTKSWVSATDEQIAKEEKEQ